MVHGLQICSMFCRFVLREELFQTKYCCSLKSKDLAPRKILGWLLHWFKVETFHIDAFMTLYTEQMCLT